MGCPMSTHFTGEKLSRAKWESLAGDTYIRSYFEDHLTSDDGVSTLRPTFTWQIIRTNVQLVQEVTNIHPEL